MRRQRAESAWHSCRSCSRRYSQSHACVCASACAKTARACPHLSVCLAVVACACPHLSVCLAVVACACPHLFVCLAALALAPTNVKGLEYILLVADNACKCWRAMLSLKSQKPNVCTQPHTHTHVRVRVCMNLRRARLCCKRSRRCCSKACPGRGSTTPTIPTRSYTSRRTQTGAGPRAMSRPEGKQGGGMMVRGEGPPLPLPLLFGRSRAPQGMRRAGGMGPADRGRIMWCTQVLWLVVRGGRM